MNGFQALISSWKGCISGLSDFEGCMKQGQTRHTEGTSLREIVTQTMKELRSQTGDSESIQRLVNRRRLLRFGLGAQ